MGKSKIDWTEYTWNPIVGCSKISPGCLHCYAEKMAFRLAAMGLEKYKAVIGSKKLFQIPTDFPHVNKWNGKCFLSESELEKPFHWKQPRRIFVGSMGDLFHKNNSFENIDRVMAVIALCHWHKFLFLTKRAERMAEYFSRPNINEIITRACNTQLNAEMYLGDEIQIPLPNLHLGVTAENQEMADLRIPILLQIPAALALRFVSIEPMLGGGLMFLPTFMIAVDAGIAGVKKVDLLVQNL